MSDFGLSPDCSLVLRRGSPLFSSTERCCLPFSTVQLFRLSHLHWPSSRIWLSIPKPALWGSLLHRQFCHVPWTSHHFFDFPWVFETKIDLPQAKSQLPGQAIWQQVDILCVLKALLWYWLCVLWYIISAGQHFYSPVDLCPPLSFPVAPSSSATQGRVDGIPPKDCHSSLFWAAYGWVALLPRSHRLGLLDKEIVNVAQMVLHAFLREQRVLGGTWRALSLRKWKKKDLQ